MMSSSRSSTRLSLEVVVAIDVVDVVVVVVVVMDGNIISESELSFLAAGLLSSNGSGVDNSLSRWFEKEAEMENGEKVEFCSI